MKANTTAEQKTIAELAAPSKVSDAKSTEAASDVKSTRQPFIGPQENHETWRSRKSHSEADMMKVYKELFFAGFPATEEYELNRSNYDNNNKDKSPSSSTTRTTRKVCVLPEKYVYDFFAHYGKIEKMTYDPKRGMGSVTFEEGAAGEQCYLTAHLSVVAHPFKDKKRTILQNEESDSSDNDMCSKNQEECLDLILYLEIAQCCPFVNPAMMLTQELQSGDISRSLLNTFPLIERKYNAHVANEVIVYWEKDEEASGVEELSDHDDDDDKTNKKQSNGINEESNATHATSVSHNNKKSNNNTESKLINIKRIGPIFPGGEVQPAILTNSLWGLLQPTWITSVSNSEKLHRRVTVLDCWWEYYHQYVVHKTQPSADRIHHNYFAFAQRASVVQEMTDLMKLEQGIHTTSTGNSKESFNISSGMTEEEAAKLLDRLRSDMTFHGTLVYLSHKQKLRYDPSWCSLMRDIYKSRAVNSAMLRYYTSQTNALKQKMAMEATLSASVENLVADKDWLAMSLITAAQNVIKNTRFLHQVEYKKNKKTIMDVDDNKKAAKKQNKTNKVNKDKSNNQQRVKKDQQEEEEEETYDDERESQTLYLEVVENIEGYASSGSAASLLSICEDYFSFVSLPGHIGYNALHNTHSICKDLLRALMVPLLLIAFIIALIVYFNIGTPLAPPLSASHAKWKNYTNRNGSEFVEAFNRVRPSHPNVHIRLAADM